MAELQFLTDSSAPAAKNLKPQTAAKVNGRSLNASLNTAPVDP
jgi:hypothetical protein